MEKDGTQMLELSKKERKVLAVLKKEKSTPLEISRDTKVTRPSVYVILDKLKKRGLVTTKIVQGRKYWLLENPRNIEEALYATKKYLLNISEDTEEVHGRSESNITIYKKEKDIQKLIIDIIHEAKNAHLFGFQGANQEIGWSKVFSEENTNKINRMVKENKIIVEGVMPTNWFEKHSKEWGKEWVEGFSGRMTIAHEIDEKYFKHGAQLFATRKAVYLFSFNESLAIEIRNSEIQKMVVSMFSYMQSHATKIDPNEILKGLVEKIE